MIIFTFSDIHNFNLGYIFSFENYLYYNVSAGK